MHTVRSAVGDGKINKNRRRSYPQGVLARHNTGARCPTTSSSTAASTTDRAGIA
jgi:hypothetical protein